MSDTYTRNPSVASKLDLLNEIDDWTEEGRFKGHPAARQVLKHYVQYMWTIDATTQYPKASRMHVMDGCIWPAVVAAKTGLDKKSVQRANKFLEETGLVRIERAVGPQGGQPMPVDIEVVVLQPDGFDASHLIGNNSGLGILNPLGTTSNPQPIRHHVAHNENTNNEKDNGPTSPDGSAGLKTRSSRLAPSEASPSPDLISSDMKSSISRRKPPKTKAQLEYEQAEQLHADYFPGYASDTGK